MVTYKFHPERNLPDKIGEAPCWIDGTPTNTGIANFEFPDSRTGRETSLFEESPGVFRESFMSGDVNGAILLSLMHAGVLGEFQIPISDVLNLDDAKIQKNGHLDMKVVDGLLKVSLKK